MKSKDQNYFYLRDRRARERAIRYVARHHGDDAAIRIPTLDERRRWPRVVAVTIGEDVDEVMQRVAAALEATSTRRRSRTKPDSA